MNRRWISGLPASTSATGSLDARLAHCLATTSHLTALGIEFGAGGLLFIVLASGAPNHWEKVSRSGWERLCSGRRHADFAAGAPVDWRYSAGHPPGSCWNTGRVAWAGCRTRRAAMDESGHLAASHSGSYHRNLCHKGDSVPVFASGIRNTRWSAISGATCLRRLVALLATVFPSVRRTGPVHGWDSMPRFQASWSSLFTWGAAMPLLHCRGHNQLHAHPASRALTRLCLHPVFEIGDQPGILQGGGSMLDHAFVFRAFDHGHEGVD